MSHRFLAELVQDPGAFLGARPRAAVVTRHGDGPALMSIDDVDSLVSGGTLTYPMMAMARNGQKLPPSSYTWGEAFGEPGHQNAVRQDFVARELATGASIILESAHRLNRSVAGFAHGLSRELRTFVSVSAYLTPPSAQGFRHHFDVDDAFIIQLSGSKRWELFSPIFDNPLDQDYFQGVSAYPGLDARIAAGPEVAVTLSEGDVLFLPGGWIHNPYATEEWSLHATLALVRKPRYWALRKMVELSSQDDWVREEILPGSTNASFSEQQVVELAERFALWAKTSKHDIAAAIEASYSREYMEPHVSAVRAAMQLPLMPGDVLIANGENVVSCQVRSDCLALTLTGGEMVGVPLPLAEEFMKSVDSGHRMEVGELVGLLGDGGQAALSEMVVRGIVSVQTWHR